MAHSDINTALQGLKIGENTHQVPKKHSPFTVKVKIVVTDLKLSITDRRDIQRNIE